MSNFLNIIFLHVKEIIIHTRAFVLDYGTLKVLSLPDPLLEAGLGARLDDLVDEGLVRVERLVALEALSADVARERRLASVLTLMDLECLLVPGTHFNSKRIGFEI